MRKVGSVEMGFRGEKDHGCCRREGALVAETGKTEWSTQGYTQGEHFLKAIGWVNKRD